MTSSSSDGHSIDSNDDLARHQVNRLEAPTPQSSNPNEKSSSPPSIKLGKQVPLKDRRGLLSKLVITPEYEDAREYPNSIKYLIVTIVGLAAISGPMGTSIMLPAIDDITINLNTQVSVVNLSVGVYLLALGIFPLWWSALSERNGRRSIYLVSFTMFLGFSIGTSLAPNIAGLIILRVFQGGCSASVQAVGAGTISDLYEPHQRGRALGWYYLGPLMGPFLAPIIGGVVGEVWGWRATQWVLVIVSGCNVLLILFFLPETLRKSDNIQVLKDFINENVSNDGHVQIDDDTLSRIASITPNSIREEEENDEPILDFVMPSISRLTTNRSTYSQKIKQKTLGRDLRKLMKKSIREGETSDRSWETFKTSAYDVCIRPLHSLVLLLYPPVLLVISYSGICFAVIYFFNLTITNEYSLEPYRFNQIIVGLLYIPNSVTYILASIIGGRWIDHLLRKYALSHNGELAPESRLSWNVVLAVALMPPACLIFGWTLDYGLHWAIPLIGTALFGFASMLLIGATVTYLVDTLPGKGATGIALNNLIRQILAAIASFVVKPLLNAIGPGILFSILMGITTVCSIALIYVKRNGDHFREKYDLSKLYEKL